MKFSIKLTYIIPAVILLFLACDDESTKGVSRITSYAIIELQGEQWIRVDQGDTWTDPGAIATEGDATIEVVVGGDEVDTNVPGVYTITYTATNKDDFSSTEYRYVGVISPSVSGIDISGAYQRNAGAFGVSTVTKIDDNFYMTDNVGGVAVPGPTTTVYFYHYDDGLLDVPFQLVQGSEFSCTDETVDVGESYSWVVVNSGYGSALRTFVKQ